MSITLVLRSSQANPLSIAQMDGNWIAIQNAINALSDLATQRAPARVVATTNINIASPGTTIDGVTLASGDRILLTGQTTGSQNGLWTFNGSASALTRTADYSSGSTTDAFYGIEVPILAGTANAGTTWYLTTTAAITIDTTSTAWGQIIINLSNSGNFIGTLSIALGGTGQTTASASFNALSPVTTLGDLIYGSGTNTNARLAGSTSTTPAVLMQTGTGTASAAPVWTLTTGTGAPVLAISPALTGTPTTPTAAVNTNTTQMASTAFVITQTGYVQRKPQSVSYTLVATDYMVAYTGGTTATFTLPAIPTAGKVYIIKNSASAAVTLTVTPNGANTIDGAASSSLTQHQSLTIVSDGVSNWEII